MNATIPSAERNIQEHRKQFKRLWSSFVELVNILRKFNPLIAIEWPRNCVYWKWTSVERFIARAGLTGVNFDGCALGIKHENGLPIMKPWKVMTNCPELITALGKYKCPANHTHAEGRGESLKRTESYTWKMVDVIHGAFAEAARASRHSSLACPAVGIMLKQQEDEAHPIAREEALGIAAENAAIPIAVPEGDLLWTAEAPTPPEHYGDSIRSWDSLVSNLNYSLRLAKDQRVGFSHNLGRSMRRSPWAGIRVGEASNPGSVGPYLELSSSC